MQLEDKVAFLRKPESYPHDPPEVEAIETHMRRLSRDLILDARIRAGGELPGRKIGRIADGLASFLRRDRVLMDDRVRTGRIVDGHGDVRPEHVCLEPEPVIIGCLEFNARFREVDPADELSFLAMECARLGARELGDGFLER